MSRQHRTVRDFQTSVTLRQVIHWRTVKNLCGLYDIPVEDMAARFLGIKTDLQLAIENALEIGAANRALLLSMYNFMREHGPLAEANAS